MMVGNRGKLQRIRGIRVILGTIGALAALGAASASSATAEDRFVSPSGSGAWPCTQEAPCALLIALSNGGLQAGDRVLLAGGTYSVGPGTALVSKAVTVMPQAGATRPTIVGTGDSAVVRLFSPLPARATLRGVDLLNTGGGFAMETQGPAIIEDIYAMSTSHVALLKEDSVVRNSVFFTDANNASTIITGLRGLHLRNVTAIGNGTGSTALDVSPSYGMLQDITVVNSVFRAGPDAASYDIQIRDFGEPRGSVRIANSAFRSSNVRLVSDSITYSSSGGHVDASSSSLMLGSAAARFVPLPGSPLINRGTAAPARLFGHDIGPLDFTGRLRVQGGKPDIGAYERAVLVKIGAKGKSKSKGRKVQLKIRCDEDCAQVKIAGGVKPRTLKNFKANRWKTVSVKVRKPKAKRVQIKLTARDSEGRRVKKIRVRL